MGTWKEVKELAKEHIYALPTDMDNNVRIAWGSREKGGRGQRGKTGTTILTYTKYFLKKGKCLCRSVYCIVCPFLNDFSNFFIHLKKSTFGVIIYIANTVSVSFSSFKFLCNQICQSSKIFILGIINHLSELKIKKNNNNKKNNVHFSPIKIKFLVKYIWFV